MIFIWLLLGFILLLYLDLHLFHRKTTVLSMKASFLLTAFWISCALAFNAYVWWSRGNEKALEFLTSYLIEKMLSIDNLFVFLILFKRLDIPKHLQHRTLFYGIFGALAFRLIMILVGIELIQRFYWITYFFGALLIFAGWQALTHEHLDQKTGLSIINWLRKRLPITSNLDGEKFFTRIETGALVATPLFVALVAIECTDIVFAVDSIPAVLAITLDPFIVFTSNAFAILGLRSFYFVLSNMMEMFSTLHYGIGAILLFVGAKFLLAPLIHVPILVSLGIIATILVVNILLSYSYSNKVD